MKDLIEFVETWEKEKNAEALIAKDISLPSAENIQSYLASLSSTERSRITQTLSDAMEALSTHTIGMEDEISSLKGQIDQNLQSKAANLAYNNTTKKPRSSD